MSSTFKGPKIVEPRLDHRSARLSGVCAEQEFPAHVVLVRKDGKWLYAADAYKPHATGEQAIPFPASDRPRLRVLHREVWRFQDLPCGCKRSRANRPVPRRGKSARVDGGSPERRCARDPIGAVLALGCLDAVQRDIVSGRIGPNTRVAVDSGDKSASFRGIVGRLAQIVDAPASRQATRQARRGSSNIDFWRLNRLRDHSSGLGYEGAGKRFANCRPPSHH
jgi:hypothetical protein